MPDTSTEAAGFESFLTLGVKVLTIVSLRLNHPKQSVLVSPRQADGNQAQINQEAAPVHPYYLD